MKKDVNKIANEITKMFIDNNISISMQLEILKTLKQKAEFCRKTGKEINQNKLEL